MRSRVTGASLGGATNLALMGRVRTGFVPGPETITYLERLRRLLNAMHSARRNQREAELDPATFPDTIGRFTVIHQFRYAVWTAPQDSAAPGEPPRSFLTLNVSFDAGWEPYMRVIYRDIGALLDALLCHVEGYPGSQVDFDRYCRWVRSAELDAGIFYADHGLGPSDARYLDQVDRLRRGAPTAGEAERAAARHAMAPLKRQLAAVSIDATNAAEVKRKLAVSMRTLKGLYRLVPYFAGSEAPILLNFARLALGDSRPTLEQVFQQLVVDRNSPVGTLAAMLAPELAWLLAPGAPPAAPPVPEALDPQALQPLLLRAPGAPAPTHGVLLLLRVDDADAAGRTVADWADNPPAPVLDGDVAWQWAFSPAGLAALGVAPWRLDALAPEFLQGMQARHGVLGDLHHNHPNQWQRPSRHGSAAGESDRIDLGSVHVLLQLRLHDPADSGHDLHPKLRPLIELPQAAGRGFTLLALQPMRAQPHADGVHASGHFGFMDGLSQPRPVPQPAGTDEVRHGELFLGHANDREDAALPAHTGDPLWHLGSYLVVRKLRQRVDRLDRLVPDRSVRAKMMGRDQDGWPLLGPKPRPETVDDNRYSYDDDPHGEHCPFQSHVRRANPRDGRRYLPRILRRGMSYGPAVGAGAGEADAAADRGVVFMAYCASIAEQFETLQGWMAGGNSSGLASTLSDPFLGLAAPGRTRHFQYSDGGAPRQLNLGSLPLVELQWGLYLFVPSRAGLRSLHPQAARPLPKLDPAPPPAPVPSALEQARLVLEDNDRSPAHWAQVRAAPGAVQDQPGYGRLVGDVAGVLQALQDEQRTRYSVKGYQLRMRDTVGVNLLGLDRVEPAHRAEAEAVNGVLDGMDEASAFAAAWGVVNAVLARFQPLDLGPDAGVGDQHVRRPVDLVNLSEAVLGGLCKVWFGLPDGVHMASGGRRPDSPVVMTGLPRCPGDLYSASRTIFAPHPNAEVQAHARVEGPAVLQAVRNFLSGVPRAQWGSLTPQIHDRLAAVVPASDLDHVFHRSIAGMLLGFLPTVHGNLMQTFKQWIEDGSLWRQQDALRQALKARPLGQAPAFADVKAVLFEPLMATMARQPVPEVLWRCPVQADGTVDEDPARRVVLGIRSALAGLDEAQRQAHHPLMFGGRRAPSDPLHTVHACPGYPMAVGVMLGLLAGLFLAGTLHPTGSPVLLVLNPLPPPA